MDGNQDSGSRVNPEIRFATNQLQDNQQQDNLGDNTTGRSLPAVGSTVGTAPAIPPPVTNLPNKGYQMLQGGVVPRRRGRSQADPVTPGVSSTGPGSSAAASGGATSSTGGGD